MPLWGPLLHFYHGLLQLFQRYTSDLWEAHRSLQVRKRGYKRGTASKGSKCFISREFGNGLVIGLGFELQVWEFLICLFVWHQVNTRAFHTLS
jgi:hypothetical protein